MGFTVVGPDRFLGSGHPDGREQLPPFLGLIESRDGGRSWRELGNVGGQPAAFESESADELHVALHDGTVKQSNDGGASWSVRLTP